MKKTFNSKEIIIDGKKHQAVYINNQIKKAFNITDDNFTEDYNDYVDELIRLGYKFERTKEA